MTTELSAKTAIVTGAAQGIGVSYARRLHDLGANVVVADVNGEGVEETAAKIADGDASRIVASRVDVADEASVASLMSSTVGRFGGLDIVVNNAAIFAGIERSPVEEMDVAYWRRVLDVNITGTFIVSRAAIPYLRARGGGVIVNQASIAAFVNSPGLAHYTVSKAAIASFTRNLACEVGVDGIRVNAIAPGFTLTDATIGLHTQEQLDAAAAGCALRQHGSPDDLCGTLEFLVTEASGWMTGQVLVVDGGRAFPR